MLGICLISFCLSNSTSVVLSQWPPGSAQGSVPVRWEAPSVIHHSAQLTFLFISDLQPQLLLCSTTFSVPHPPPDCSLHSSLQSVITTNWSKHYQKQAADPPASFTNAAALALLPSPQIPTGEYFPSQGSCSVTPLTPEPPQLLLLVKPSLLWTSALYKSRQSWKSWKTFCLFIWVFKF